LNNIRADMAVAVPGGVIEVAGDKSLPEGEFMVKVIKSRFMDTMKNNEGKEKINIKIETEDNDKVAAESTDKFNANLSTPLIEKMQLILEK
jgi:hypothetical protein